MLSKKTTQELVEKFYFDCLEFWQRENVEDAKGLAIKDCENITRNPFSPNGELLDAEAKAEVIEKLKA